MIRMSEGYLIPVFIACLIFASCKSSVPSNPVKCSLLDTGDSLLLSPTEDNLLTHCGLYRVSGSGFGEKPRGGLPLKFEDWSYDGIEKGDLLDASGYWSISSDNPKDQKPQFSLDRLRHSSAFYSAEFYWPRLDGDNDGDLDYSSQDMVYRPNIDFDGPSNDIRKIYFDTWFVNDWDNQMINQQIKTFKLQSGSQDVGNEPTFNVYHWKYNTGGTWCYALITVDGDNTISRQTVPCPSDGSWVHYQLELETNIISQSDGSFRLWQNGSLAASDSGLEIRKTTDLYDSNFTAVWLGRYFGNCEECRTTLYYAETYFDNSWARIEIGDNESYSDCTHRETQIPIVWGDESVTFRAFRGSFSSGGPLYLFVLNDDGEVIKTYNVKF